MRTFLQSLLLTAALLFLGMTGTVAQTNVIFEETFDQCDAEGGNDGKWKSPMNSAGNIADYCSGWEFANPYVAYKCIRLGSTSSKGLARTSVLSDLNGAATLTFRAGAWDSSSENAVIVVSITNGKFSYNGKNPNEVELTLERGKFTDFTLEIAEGKKNSKITFKGQKDKNNRFFLDEVKVFTGEAETPGTCNSIAEMKALKDGTSSNLVLKDAKVLKIWTTAEGTQEVYVRDATGAICLSDVGLSADGLSEGDMLNGTIAGVFKLVDKRPTVTAQTESALPNVVTKTAGEKAAPTVVSFASISSDNYCDLIALTGGTAELADDGCKVTAGDAGVLLKDVFGTGVATPYAGARLEMSGICMPEGDDTAVCPLAKTDVLYVFDEHAENTFGNAEGVSAKLLRTLSNEYWNTFCAPFSISKELVEQVFGTGTVVAKYKGDTDNTMNFEQVEALEAGSAYLMKPAETVEDPVFDGVSIASGTVEATSEGSTYFFNGVLNPTELDITTDLFITKSGTVSKIAEGKNTIYGMRAYIRCPNVDENRPRMNIGETPTGVLVVDGKVVQSNTEVFNLQGQPVGTAIEKLPNGIYVVGGKKVVKH